MGGGIRSPPESVYAHFNGNFLSNYPVESVIQYYPESGFRWNLISGYMRLSGKKVNPVHPYVYAPFYLQLQHWL